MERRTTKYTSGQEERSKVASKQQVEQHERMRGKEKSELRMMMMMMMMMMIMIIIKKV